MRESGIYRIYFEEDENKSGYVGLSTQISTRLCSHKERLRKGKHRNKELQKAFNCFGEDSLCHEVVMVCPKNYLGVAEKYVIKHYGKSNLYNSKRGGFTGNGHTRLSKEEESVIIGLYKEGFSMAEIHRRIGRSSVAIKACLRRNGVPFRDRPTLNYRGTRVKLKDENLPDILKLWAAGKKTLKEISKLYQVDYSNLIRFLNKRGYRFRPTPIDKESGDLINKLRKEGLSWRRLSECTGFSVGQIRYFLKNRN